MGLKNYRFALAPVVLCVILANLLYLKTNLRVVNNITNIWPYVAYTFELVIPAIILLAAVIRKKEAPPMVAGSDRPDSGSASS